MEELISIYQRLIVNTKVDYQRYPNWAIEIKNIYDSYPDLHIVFTGSSMLEIYKSNADLSRRAITYHLPGLSFREYLSFEKAVEHPAVSLDELIQNHQQISIAIAEKVKILPLFLKYLEAGYYPFYKESVKMYPIRLQNIVNTVLDSDLPAVESIDYSSVLKIKKLLGIIGALHPKSCEIKCRIKYQSEFFKQLLGIPT